MHVLNVTLYVCVGVCLQVEEAGAGDACFECYIICVCGCMSTGGRSWGR